MSNKKKRSQAGRRNKQRKRVMDKKPKKNKREEADLAKLKSLPDMDLYNFTNSYRFSYFEFKHKITRRIKLGLTDGEYNTLQGIKDDTHLPMTKIIRKALFKEDSAGRPAEALKLVDSLYDYKKQKKAIDYFIKRKKVMDNFQHLGINLNQAVHKLNQADLSNDKQLRQAAFDVSKVAKDINSLLSMHLKKAGSD